MIQIIIIDDHKLFRLGLKAAFQASHPDLSVTGEAECSRDLFKLLVDTPADLILLDINLPEVGGAEVALRLHREYPALKILVISGENSVETVEMMLEAGIDGFISKSHGDLDELAGAIRSIMNGYEYFGRDIASIIYGVYMSKKKTSEVTNEFTEREREIIQLCMKGLLCKEIAERMGVSVNTINTHKKNIYLKLGINNTVEMVRYALQRGIIRLEK